MAVKHFFVLMMENRSFDHLLGYCAIPGVPAPPSGATVAGNGGQRVPVTNDAVDQMGDIDHEYPSVRVQLRGPGSLDTAPVTMDGFYQANGAESLRCFPVDAPEVRVLRQLADEYCVFNNWFASVPGPTWPNRFFVHAATSGGLDNSPSNLQSIGAVTLDSLGFDFQHGSIYDWLDKAGLEWRVYHDDLLPQVLSIKGMPQHFVHPLDSHFHWLHEMEADLGSNYTPSYTFIEPSYDVVNGYKNGNSQHAAGTVSSGDALINWVYQKIRGSSIWTSSALLILSDEHGGFYDHVVPPRCTPPGDDLRNSGKAHDPQNSAFDQLGVRVPAVLVSPCVPRSTVVATKNGQAAFDHSSVIRSLIDLFPPLRAALQQAGKTSLTQRDAATASIAPLFSLTTPRTDDDAAYDYLQALPYRLSNSNTLLPESPGITLGDAPVSAFMTGATHLATAVELARQQLSTQPTLHPTLGSSGLTTEGGAQGYVRQLTALSPKLSSGG